MPLTTRDRKAQGLKFLFTLPRDWREAHNMMPGQILTVHYKGASPLVMVPKGTPLSQLEESLIAFLIEGPSSIKMKDLKTQLDTLFSHVSKMEEEMECVVRP